MLIVSLLLQLPDVPPQDQSLRVGPMNLSWYYTADQITFRVTSPEEGWIVLGSNGRDDIVGATLYFGGVNDAGKAYFSERRVVAFGRHRSFEELGLPSRVARAQSTVRPGSGTELVLTLPVTPRMEEEADLRPGTELWLILAYSVSDDLEHHSRFRRHVKVRL